MALYELRDRLVSMANPVVTGRQLATLANLDVRTAHVYLSRMVAKGFLYHVERGKFALCEDASVVASNLVYPSYISFTTALGLHGLIDQVTDKVLVVSPLKRRGLTFLSTDIRFIAMKAPLLFGYSKVKRGGFKMFLANVEKTILDILYLPRYSRLNALPTILREHADIDLLTRYNAKFAVESVNRRLGYLLDCIGVRTRIRPRTRTPYFLNPSLPHKGSFDKKWHLYVNEDL